MINGLGMGNSTRCHAIIERLYERGVEIHVLTSGNGLLYFKDMKEVSSLIAMESFFYSVKQGRISGWQTLLSVGSLLRLARAKTAQLESFLSKILPDVAIIDSEYAIGPLLKRKIPIVGLNNSEVVVSEYLRAKDNPSSIRSHFWCIEFADYLFHKRVCSLVLSPSPLRTPPRHPKFKRIGLIVRRSLLEAIRREDLKPRVAPRDVQVIVFMLSGSIHAAAISFDRFHFPFHIDVVGRAGESQGNVVFHGRRMNNIDLLMKADVLVINGGYSAFSEAIALNKTTFVIPVPGHAEQMVNARLIRDLGYGFMASETNVMDQIHDMVVANQWMGLKDRRSDVGIDGATEAADEIVSLLENRT
jgi:hypothetical protein